MAQPEYGAEIAGIYSKLENKKVENPKMFFIIPQLMEYMHVRLHLQY
jgi:hypothetical protein